MKIAVVLLGLILSTSLVQAQQQKLVIKNGQANIVDVPAGESTSVVPVAVDRPYYRASFSEKLLVINPRLNQFMVNFISVEHKEKYLYEPTKERDDLTMKTGALELNYKSTFESGLMFSFDSTLGTMNLKRTEPYTNDVKFTGFSDLFLAFTQLNAMNENTNLVYGGRLGISPDNSKIANSSTDGNRFSGGHSLQPFVGVELSRGQMAFGGQLGYNYRLDRKSVYSASDYTSIVKRGHELSLMGFAEYTIGQSVAGLSADYVGTEKSERESTENGRSSSSTSEAYSTLGVTAYGLVALSKSAHFKPSVNYSQLQQTDLNGFKAETDNTLSISLGLGSTF